MQLPLVGLTHVLKQLILNVAYTVKNFCTDKHIQTMSLCLVVLHLAVMCIVSKVAYKIIYVKCRVLCYLPSVVVLDVD